MAGLDEGILELPAVSFQNEQEYLVYDWNKKFQSKSLTPLDFHLYWASQVPLLFSPTMGCDCLNLNFNEEAAKNFLFAPLEQFICSGGSPEKVFEELKKLDDPPTLCGKVFKMGEPTYSCRDCGLDPTCVLCVYCFKSSEHRSHRYKMSMSNGGGYCDCGDKEAWKTHPFCQIHLKSSDLTSESESIINRLPQDVVEKLRLVIQVALKYCHQILTWEHAISLPSDLQPPGAENKKENEEVYATILYNDEIHTYEQVIQTLTRAIDCNQKQAIEYATITDREGRSIVKCSDNHSCIAVQNSISRITSRHGSQPLKTIVMHASVLAHQAFAMRLLAWLQQIVTHSEGFRLILSNVMMEPQGNDAPLLEEIMLTNTELWKTARNQWHQLFITGMLMDQESKKTFAKVFTRNYPELMADFTADDHEHSVSVTSLSVQIFTVPTLAHSLIEENAFSTLLRPFLTEAERYRNQDGKLAFERTSTNMRFRRAQYVLYDIKYLLTVIPDQWSDSMRKSFLHGIQQLLLLLSWMQGMDSVTRQVGQHVEFEAEWESGINLQFKLFPVVSLASEWCGSNRVILIKVIRLALKQLAQAPTPSTTQTQVVEIANHSVSCVDYEVMSLPVTVHLPLTRLITSLLLHMHKFNLTYDSHEFAVTNKPTPEQLMELPLRCLVMVAQFRVGMWRRNGYSLLNQVYFYHNVRLREEMYDRDIQMLQTAASLIEGNEFLIHLLNKFVLLGWAKISTDLARKPEDESLRPTVSLAEEFLGLILTLVSERHTPGIGRVTEADKIKKEIIQLLCIESMPHSQLLKMLPKDCNQETGMEDVIGEVANFRKPQGSTTGKYELKPEYYKDFNPFFYHYSREEQSRAQEVQLKRKKQASEEECCPPPLPPEFAPNFAILTNILQCDVMLHLMKQVLRRTVDLQSPLFSETQVEKLLHLIGVALLEDERLMEQSKTGGAEFFNFTSKATKEGILSLLEDCLKCPRIDTQKDLLKWTLKKFRFVQSLNQVGKSDAASSSQDAQGSSGAQNLSDPNIDDRKKHAEIAAARRARIMAQMSNMQKNFIRKYADLFDEAGDDDIPMGEDEIVVPVVQDPVVLGNQQRGRVTKLEQHTCILCRENQEVSVIGRTLVMSALVQHSMVLSKSRHTHQLEDPENFDPLLTNSDMFCGPHTSTCGHVMHSDCWQKFFESVLLKERRRPLRYGRHVSFNVDKNEFLCPLCERLSNTVIPLVPPISTLVPKEIYRQFDLGIDDWLTCARKTVEVIHVHRLKHPLQEEKKEEKLFYRYKPLSEVVSSLPEKVAEQVRSLFTVYQLPMVNSVVGSMAFSPSMREMMKLFSQSTYTIGLGLNPHSEDDRVALLSWWSLSYTIHSIEWLLRDQAKPLFGSLSSCQNHCLSALTRCVATSNHIYDSQTIRAHCISLLRYLLLGEYYLSNPLSVVEVDAFGLLVSLSLSMPSIYMDEMAGSAEAELLSSFGTSSPFPLGNIMDHCVFQLVYTFHLVQVLLTKEFPDDAPMETDETSSTTDNGENEIMLVQFYRDLVTAAGVHCRKTPTGEQLHVAICEGVLPFLRCAALFFHYITDVACPKELLENVDEYEPLCRYLNLPSTLSELFQSSLLRQLSLSWARHARVHYLVNADLRPSPMVEDIDSDSTTPKSPPPTGLNYIVRHPVPVNQLMELPEDYSELINSVSLFSCPNSEGDDCRSPTICLVCGTILCAQSYCCQTDLDGSMVGACTSHSVTCGAGTGMFLRIRDCKVIFLCSVTKGCYMPPPYVDDYGETDQGLLRGNPLHLCRDRYKELHRLWLSHNVPEQIAHALELSTSLAATNWQLM